MKINSQKLINWMACTFAAIVMGLFIFWTINFFVDIYLNGFNQNQQIKYQYLGIFKEKYHQNIKADTSWQTRSGDHINFYKNELSGICIIEFAQFSEVTLKNVKINNFLLKEVNNDFMKSENQLTDSNYPYPDIFYYPMHENPNQINIYIKSEIEKIIRDDKKIYIKFRKTPFEINATKKYAEFSFKCIGEFPVEFLLLKKENSTLLLYKYNTDRNEIDHLSLLNLIKL